MATYDNLPVYKTSYDMLLKLFKKANHLSRHSRFTIGEQIKNATNDMMMCLYRANKSFEKRKGRIGEAREKVETIRVMLRILKDLKQLSLKKFININENIESVSKQLVFWENSCEK